MREGEMKRPGSSYMQVLDKRKPSPWGQNFISFTLSNSALDTLSHRVSTGEFGRSARTASASQELHCPLPP